MHRVSLILVVLLLAACSDPAEPAASWTGINLGAQVGALSSVWGSSPNDVFIVGGTPQQAEIYHYDGTSWSPMTAPDVGILVWVYGFGPNDIYAVGVGGGVVHYDGQSWTKLDAGTTEDLWGVFGFAPNDIWIVGGDAFEGPLVLMHYDGTTFEQVTLDSAQNSRGAMALFKVWGIDQRLFAVGHNGLIIGYDGNNWTEQLAGPQANDDFVSLWGTSANNIVAVGGRSGARISQFDGMSWTTKAPNGIGGLNGVFMPTPTRAVVGGVNGFVGVYDTVSGELTPESQDHTVFDLHAVWGDGQGKVYAVGGRFIPPFEGAAVLRTDSVQAE